MFVSYRNFKFVSRTNVKGSNMWATVKCSVEKVTKMPFCKEKVETVDIFLDGIMWIFAKTGKYAPIEIKRLADVWQMENNTYLTTIGQR